MGEEPPVTPSAGQAAEPSARYVASLQAKQGAEQPMWRYIDPDGNMQVCRLQLHAHGGQAEQLSLASESRYGLPELCSLQLCFWLLS